MTHRRDPRSGTTLLEMMIALAIMAMIAVMLSSLLSGTAQFLGRATLVGKQIDQIVARDQLRTYLQGALVSPFPNYPRSVFRGDGQSITFLTSQTSGIFWPGAAVQVDVSKEPSSGVIVLQVEGRDLEENATVKARLQLTGRDGSIAVSYFGQWSLDNSPAWRADWSAGWAPPRLVRLTLSDADRIYPPLVMQPGLDLFQSDMSASSLLPPATPSRP
jgi:prepilin-type N-terminal cleavage/methylation domain-containing protein